jgi:hypothetical protein
MRFITQKPASMNLIYRCAGTCGAANENRIPQLSAEKN